MSLATQQEIVSHAVAGEAIVTPVGRPLDRRERVLKEGQKKLKEGTFGIALEAMQSESPLETQKLHQITQEFGTKIKDDGTIEPDTRIDPTTRKTEKAMRDEVRQEIDLLQKLTEKGYMSTEITQTERDKIREIVKVKLLSNSSISKDLQQRADNHTLDDYLDELIQNPAFNPKLKEVVNGYSRTLELDTTFIEAYEQFRNAEADVEAATKKAEQAQLKINRLRAEAAAYEKDPATGAEGPFYQKLATLKNQGGTPQEEIVSLENDVAGMRDEIAKLERQTTLGDKSLTIFNTQGMFEEAQEDLKRYQGFLDQELAKDTPNSSKVDQWTRQVQAQSRTIQNLLSAQSNAGAEQPRMSIADAHKRIDFLRESIRERERDLAIKKAGPADLAALTSQHETLRQQEDQALKELAEANADVSKFGNARVRAKQEYDRAVDLRKAQQQTLTERLSASYGEAAHRLIVDQMVLANKEGKTLHDELQKEAVSDAEKGLLNYISTSRWHFPERTERRGLLGFRRTVTYRPTDRGAINNDWHMLLNQGEDAMVKDMLSATTNPDTGNTYTADEIADIYKDPETVARMKDFAVKNLTLKRIQNGGMTVEDIDVMTQKALGKDADAALSQRTDLRQQIEKMMGAGALERHDFKSRFAQIIRQYPWLLLSLLAFPLALLGPVSLPVASAAAAVGPGTAGIWAKQMTPQEEQLHARG